MYWLFGPKNQCLRNKSGKTQPIRTKFGIPGQVKGWQRSGNFGRDRPILGKMGIGTIPAERIFCLVNHATFRQLRNGPFSPNLVTKWRNAVRCHVAESGITFSKIFTLGVICPQNLKLKIGQTGTSLGAGYRSRGLLHVVVQGPGSFRDWWTFLYDVWLRSYWASKLPNFTILAYFPHTKPLKRTFRWSAYSPGVTPQNDSIFPCGRRRSKGIACDFW